MRREHQFILVGFLCLLIFCFILFELLSNGFLMRGDIVVNRAMTDVHTNFLTSIAKVIDLAFDALGFAILTALVCMVLWWKKLKKEAVWFASVMVVSFGCLYILKHVVHRVRPQNALVQASDFAFPSGHMLAAVVFFGVLAYLILKKGASKNVKLWSTIVALLLIVLIAISRLYLNVHWFTDVIASVALGGLVISLSLLFQNTKNVV